MKSLEQNIFKGLCDGNVEIIQSPNDDCIACKIGEHWFYFIGNEDENLTSNEVLESYTKEELTTLICSAIIGLDGTEQKYYQYWLEENLD